jgi:hypothetical protein
MVEQGGQCPRSLDLAVGRERGANIDLLRRLVLFIELSLNLKVKVKVKVKVKAKVKAGSTRLRRR